MTTRKEQAARSKQMLQDAAQKLIETKGYDSISVSDITKACGMSTGNFYHYFNSKEEVFTELERQPYFDMLVDLDAIKKQPLMEQIRFYIYHWVELMADCWGVNFNKHWISHYVKHPEKMEPKNNKLDIIAKEVSVCLENGVKNGDLSADTPIQNLSYSIAFTLVGMTAYYCMTEGSFPAQEWKKDFCDILEKAVLYNYHIVKSK